MTSSSSQLSLIYKSNALVEASYQLSVAEQRIILACIAQVRRGTPVTDEILYSVSADDIARLSGSKSKSLYSELADAALRLQRRLVRIALEPNGKGKRPKILVTGWVQSVVYVEAEGRIELRFSKDMLPHLTELTRQFTKYSLSDVAKMTSAHAIRLYELLVQWDDKGEREIGVEDFRAYLSLEGRHSLMAELRREVIEPSVKQLNKHSPLQVSWEPRRTGRKITSLVFTFKPKTVERAEKPKQTGMTEREMARLARPGETWEQLRLRLGAQSKPPKG